jgi:phosphoglycolate phosphatase-like HAD superfamily hydrolase
MINKLALFDCDGTMVDSQANICASMDQAFEKHGLIPPDHHLVRRIVGLSLLEAVARLLPEGDEEIVASVTQSYKDRFMTDCSKHWNNWKHPAGFWVWPPASRIAVSTMCSKPTACWIVS